ncbi:collagen alpha-2(VIII) chain-like [Mytilus californianus]|uniref:collagen alpha-2(VIII) chain-like n=1 Tax=Mytilus californianus TaxID=6549 RepID=UPI002245D202|nr:collagen alpha-2(VIII) chain-like [Mytilus californianus]
MKSSVTIVFMIGVIQIGQTVAACKKDLSEDLLDLLIKCRNQKTEIDGLTRKTRPAFTASLTAKKALAANQVMIFDKVWLNTGDIYNPSTGVFTVPMNGLYLVSSSMMSDKRTHLHCHLWRNAQPNVGVFGTGYSQGTLNAVMDLKKGEHLTIRHHNGGVENAYGYHWSMFSAYLISE